MNFTTYVLQDIKRLLQTGMDRPVLLALQSTFLAAHKYVVPPPRALRTKVTAQAMRFIRPMYPEVLFEYEVPDAHNNSAMLPGLKRDQDLDSSKRRVTMVLDLRRSQSAVAGAIRRDLARKENSEDALQAEIAVIGFYYIERDDRRIWLPATGYATWSSQWPSPEMFIDGTTQKLTYGISPLFPEMLAMILQSQPASASAEAVMRNDIHEDLAHAIRMMALINARNLKTVCVVPEPRKLNAKRLERDRPPFFAYHTLDIFVTGQQPKRRNKLPSPHQLQQLWAANNMPLQHVTGHINHRGQNLWWVDSYYRGSRDVGTIVSQHRVR